MPNQRTPEELFHLVLLGVTWVRESTKNTTPGWSGNGVLQTIKRAGGISELQFRSITFKPSQALKDYFVGQSVMVWPDERNRMHSKFKESGKLLGVLVRGALFTGDRIFQSKGYLVLATPKGGSTHRE